ncbi:MAG: 50S ribosomal protein L35 [Patescibacteria group bacterium]
MKLKTHKGLAKRITVTKNGKLKKRRAFQSHLMSSKSKKRKRKMGKTHTVNRADAKMVRRLLPYA